MTVRMGLGAAWPSPQMDASAMAAPSSASRSRSQPASMSFTADSGRPAELSRRGGSVRPGVRGVALRARGAGLGSLGHTEIGTVNDAPGVAEMIDQARRVHVAPALRRDPNGGRPATSR